MAPGVPDQLSGDHVLDPLQELLQAGRLRLVLVLQEELLRGRVLRLRLGPAGGGGAGLDLGLSAEQRSGLTASLKHQQRKTLMLQEESKDTERRTETQMGSM